MNIAIYSRKSKLTGKGDVGDFAKLIEKLNRSGTAFISIKEQFDTSTSMGRAMMNVSAVLAQLERETIAERVRDNMYLMEKDSCRTGGTTPLGYISERVEYSDGGKARAYFRLTVQESEAAVVQLIYSEYLKTHSCRAVEYHLFEEGFRTRKGVLFDDVAVRRISRHIKKLRRNEGQVQSYRENLTKNITKSISEKQKQADNLTLSLASGNLNGAALEYVNRSLNVLLKEIEELKVFTLHNSRDSGCRQIRRERDKLRKGISGGAL